MSPTSRTSVQHIFRSHFDAYRKHHRVPLKVLKCADALKACRTPDAGADVQRCPDGHYERLHFHSCRHRACPKCSARTRNEWADKQLIRTLDCDHFHVVFTLPHELLPLWRYNTRLINDLLFGCARDSLIELLSEPQHGGFTPGLMMVEHTWGRSLNVHPHIHCLVTGGGLDKNNQWQSIANGFLLPVRLVKAAYRRRFLKRLWQAWNDEHIRMPANLGSDDVIRLLQQQTRKPWNVWLQTRYGHGQGVVKYLARYVRGGAIRNEQLSEQDGQIILDYRSHASGKKEQRHFSVEQFISRVLVHVPEQRQHSVRMAGLYSHRSYPKRAICRVQLEQPPEPVEYERQDWQAYLASLGHETNTHCPKCGKPLLQSRGYNQNSYKEEWHWQGSDAIAPQSTFAQQVVGGITAQTGIPPPHAAIGAASLN